MTHVEVFVEKGGISTASYSRNFVMEHGKRKLTDNEIKILEKGLKFTPTPRAQNIEEIKNDLNKYSKSHSKEKKC